MKSHMERPTQSHKNIGWGGIERPEPPTRPIPPPNRISRGGYMGWLDVSVAMITVVVFIGAGVLIYVA